LALAQELRNTYVVKKSEPDKTRDQVARTILEGGPASAVDLAEKLSITPTGIRRHLETLIAEGVLTAREPYQGRAVRGRGRPSKVFVMTDSGREKFEHSYDDLAVAALKFMASKNGSHLVDEFAQSRANEFVRKGEQIKSSSKSVSEKSKALAKLLTKEGYSFANTTAQLPMLPLNFHNYVKQKLPHFRKFLELMFKDLQLLPMVMEFVQHLFPQIFPKPEKLK